MKPRQNLDWCTSKTRGKIRDKNHFLSAINGIIAVHKDDIDKEKIERSIEYWMDVYNNQDPMEFIANARKDFTKLYTPKVIK